MLVLFRGFHRVKCVRLPGPPPLPLCTVLACVKAVKVNKQPITIEECISMHGCYVSFLHVHFTRNAALSFLPYPEAQALF